MSELISSIMGTLFINIILPIIIGKIILLAGIGIGLFFLIRWIIIKMII